MAEPKSNNRRSSSPPAGRFGHWMREPEKAKDVRGTLLRIWDYLKHQGWGLAATTVLVAVSSLLGLLGPYLMGKAVDDYILKNDMPGLLLTAGQMLGVYVLTSLFSWLQTYVMSAASQKAISDIRNELFAKLQTLSLRYFDQRTHGELMSRLSNDVENISVVITSSVTGLLSSVISIVGVAVMMFVINARLALVSLVTLPLSVILSRAIAKRTRKGFRQRQERLGDLNGIIEETITGQRVVKAYVREQIVIDQFDTTNAELRVASTRAEILAGTLGPLNNFINNVSYAIVAGAGGWMAVQGVATVGAIISFVNYARRFSWPLNQLLNLYNQIQSAIAGAERVFEVIDE
ncbi:MAG: ABC transporter ATP-binding protein, partial [Anaerolineae bacterium]|nr:ABC transporter ATP-binding protein [Anaerolineae bacterium]